MTHRTGSAAAKSRGVSAGVLRRVAGAGLALLLASIPGGALLPGAAGTLSIPVSITSSANPADAGLPFELTADVPGPPGQYLYNWTDSQGGSAASPTWEVDPSASGNLTVTLLVTSPDGGRGTAGLTISVRPPPSVVAWSPLSTVDAGVPAPFFLRVTGGVPPLTGSWLTSNDGENGSAGWAADGNYSEWMEFSTTGPAWVLARIVDALGDSTSTAELLTEVVPTPFVDLRTNGTVGEVGRAVGLNLEVEDGAPPFQWSLSSSLAVPVGVGLSGVFPEDGLYDWNLSFASAGTAGLNLTLTDALGAVETTSAAVQVEPALSVNLTAAGSGPGGPITVEAGASGGVAPYSFVFQCSDGEVGRTSLATPGETETVFGPVGPGNYSLEVQVTDGLGAGQTAETSLAVRADPVGVPRSSPNTLPEDVGLLAITVVVVLVVLFAHRRRRKAPTTRPDPPSPTAHEVVRDLLQRSREIDRDTLVLLAEEAGEETESIHAAIHALIRSGETEVESSTGGVDILRWKSPDPSKPPGNGIE